MQADPKFAATASGDLQLTAGSPAIDRGDSGVSGEQTSDLLGNAAGATTQRRPTPTPTGPRLYDDLGAYEFQPDVASAPTGPAASCR